MAGIRMSTDQFEEIMRKRGQKVPDEVQEVKKAKYGNKRVKIDGINFDSKAEGK